MPLSKVRFTLALFLLASMAQSVELTPADHLFASFYEAPSKEGRLREWKNDIGLNGVPYLLCGNALWREALERGYNGNEAKLKADIVATISPLVVAQNLDPEVAFAVCALLSHAYDVCGPFDSTRWPDIFVLYDGVASVEKWLRYETALRKLPASYQAIVIGFAPATYASEAQKWISDNAARFDGESSGSLGDSKRVIALLLKTIRSTNIDTQGSVRLPVPDGR